MSKRSSGSHAGGPSPVKPRLPAAAGDPISLEDECHDLAAESIGQYLSQQRRLRGISVDQLAEITRIPRRSIDRLEAGHFDQDVDGFVRGFVRTVAGGLGLDPEDTLSRMLAEPSGDSAGAGPISLLLGRSLVMLAALLLVGLALGVVRAVWQVGERSEARGGSEALVWRSDPIRALAEAHAAGVAPPPGVPAQELTAE